MTVNNTDYDVLVIGGGAAGMMAALEAAKSVASVAVLERNPKVGRKIYITGKGRCNLTNHCTSEDVLNNTVRNAKFLYSSMRSFSPEHVMEFFRDLGVPLKVERGERVFPCSDKASDIIDALFFALRRAGVHILQERAEELMYSDGKICGVRCEENQFSCSAVILATGGLSYPTTGSTGDGYRMAENVGHTVISPRGSLVPLESDDECCKEMQGLSLRNVLLRLLDERGKTIYREQGELLFTHFGVSGPVVLSASAHLSENPESAYTISIDLKPALDEKKLDARLLRDLEEKANSNISTLLAGLVPASMIPVIAKRIGVRLDSKAHELRRESRLALLKELKEFKISIKCARPVAEAIITAGGIKTGEVNPKTMESKKLPGLFFAGEILDVDAYTGGFNLQIAWATGYSAGRGVAEYIKEIAEYE